MPLNLVVMRIRNPIIALGCASIPVASATLLADELPKCEPKPKVIEARAPNWDHLDCRPAVPKCYAVFEVSIYPDNRPNEVRLIETTIPSAYLARRYKNLVGSWKFEPVAVACSTTIKYSIEAAH